MFDTWLHEQGYTYNGEAPITGLTQFELDKLQLGRLVQRDLNQEAAHEPGRSSGHSKSRQSTRQMAKQIAHQRA